MKSQKVYKPKNIINNIQVPSMTHKGNAGLPIYSNEKQIIRAIVFVDANNYSNYNLNTRKEVYIHPKRGITC